MSKSVFNLEFCIVFWNYFGLFSLKIHHRTPSKGLARKPFFLKGWIKKCLLLFLSAFFWFYKKRLPIPDSPRRILICNTASLGDVVIATTVLPILKVRYPEVEIGFLTSSKTAQVLKDHPLVSFVHTIDHWFCNQEKGFLKAFFCYLIDYRRVVQEIKQYDYDLAIDLYPHFFLSAIPLLWSAKIPARAGYPLQGFSHLLTTIITPQSPNEYMGQNHLRFLKELGIDISKQSPLPFYDYRNQNARLYTNYLKNREYGKKAPRFPPTLAGEVESGSAAIPTEADSSSGPSIKPNGYVVVHMGTGYQLKEWNTEKWIQVVQKLMDQGEKVVLTGKGGIEQTHCDRVASKSGCINYCNRLEWSEFARVVQQAKLLISVDSSSVHLASAVQIPCLVLFAGISSIPVWSPPYPLCKALMAPISCAPCLIRNGCSSMACIQQISIEEVLFHANQLLQFGQNQTPCIEQQFRS